MSHIALLMLYADRMMNHGGRSPLLGVALLFWISATSAVFAAEDVEGPGAKTIDRIYSGMRSGVVRTANGWDAKDFAASLMNPNSEELTVSWKLTSDDPKYVFRDGRVGVWTGTKKIAAMQGATLNFYSPAAQGRYDPAVTNFPVAALTNFTGSVEFSGSLPFYVFSGHQFESAEGVADDPDMAWYKAWYAGASDVVPAAWDSDLGEFVIPYTNYWHNVREWPTGWHSTLTLKNNTERTVIYSIQHSVNYGRRKDPAEHCVSAEVRNQTVEIALAKGQELSTTLESLFNWPINQTSYLEGILLIRPDLSAAGGKGTTVASSMVPNTFGTGMCESEPVMSAKMISPVVKTSGIIEVNSTTLDTPFYRIQRVELYVDGRLVATKITKPYQFSWDTNSVPNGQHNLQITALDAEGESTSDSENVMVSNPPPH